MKGGMLTVLVAGALVLFASNSTLAAGKLGGASQLDRFQVAVPAEVQDDAGNEDVAPLFTPGGKIGVQGGGDD
jgi:hypothetical protein